MKVGILGSGDVGRALGTGFRRHGHEVTIGSRDPAKLDEWVAETDGGSAGSFAEAAEFGELIVLATLGSATEAAIDVAGVDSFAGKTVIDATNPLESREGGAPQLYVERDDSQGQIIQRKLPEAQVVKAFNIVGNRYMVDPDLPGGPPTMLIAGDDPDAKARVTEILDDFGWEVVDVGGIDGARSLEEICIAWTRVGLAGGGWNHAFKLLRAG
jgi:predicted dinucleotide-binding enzyme